MRRSQKVLAEIAADYEVEISDIIGRGRSDYFVEARRAAILALKAAGISHGAIARVLSRHQSTIRYHCDPKFEARKKAKMMKRRAISTHGIDPEVVLNAEIFRLVSDYAKAEKIGIDTAANELLRQSLGAAA